MEKQDIILEFVKALADTNRLKIVGLLAQRSYTGEELAALVGLQPSTVSHHLSKLAHAGLVSVVPEGYYNLYSLDRSALERKSRRLFSNEQMNAVALDVDLDAYDRKVVGDFIRSDGSLKEIPTQRKKLEAVLRYVVKSFMPGKRYPEKQVNSILSRFHEDTAFLRRELVGCRLMERDGGGGEYWRK
jgi:predicted transcriptional regulator